MAHLSVAIMRYEWRISSLYSRESFHACDACIYRPSRSRRRAATPIPIHKPPLDCFVCWTMLDVEAACLPARIEGAEQASGHRARLSFYTFEVDWLGPGSGSGWLCGPGVGGQRPASPGPSGVAGAGPGTCVCVCVCVCARAHVHSKSRIVCCVTRGTGHKVVPHIC